MTAELIAQFDALIRRDPARRGLISSEAQFGPLCPGHLTEAAAHLADHGQTVGIVTGFYVSGGDVPAAETDGPIGALVLGAALRALGMTALIITDAHCFSAVSAAAAAIEFPDDRLVSAPGDIESWLPEFFLTESGRSISHLISVERVGPSHTSESLEAQPGHQAEDTTQFLNRVPAETRNRCHNMRGEIIDGVTPGLHRLFEDLHRYCPRAKTVGIGDGANEIGMGAIAWRELIRRLDGEHAPRIPCRVATDWNIVAGTSNWGAYALAASVAALRGGRSHLRPWGLEQQQQMLEAVVRNGPAVDGKTRQMKPTVDGLPFMTYIQPWLEMRRLMGLESELQVES